MALRGDNLGAELAELGARQHGVVSVGQLRALGLSAEAVRTRVRRGFLHRVHLGVYALGHPRLTQRASWMAAVLACGERAALSHGAAAALWGLRRRTSASIDVTVASGSGRVGPAGVRVHRCALLGPDEIACRERIPAVSPERTVVDLAAGATFRQVERLVGEAQRLRLCSEASLKTALEAHPTRAGTRCLREVLDRHDAARTVTRSELEERFFALCDEHGLPRPEANVRLLDYTVDFYWPDACLVVEVDGFGSHSTPLAFQDDRERDTRLRLALGMPPLRLTWWDVTGRRVVSAHRVRAALRQSKRVAAGVK